MVRLSGLSFGLIVVIAILMLSVVTLVMIIRDVGNRIALNDVAIATMVGELTVLNDAIYAIKYLESLDPVEEPKPCP